MNDYGNTVYPNALTITNPTPREELSIEISPEPVSIVEVK